MARFQKTTPRKDEVPRRPLTAEDLAFLAELQSELNTQDTMGNRDPRFWVIKQTETKACGPDDADGPVFLDEGGARVAHGMEGLLEFLRDAHGKDAVQWTASGAGTYRLSLRDAGGGLVQELASDEHELADAVESAGLGRYEPAYECGRSRIVPDTLFLTHRACEDHLRKYGYNYEQDAHAYAMTAVRSPQFEKLVELLQTIDWKAMAGKGEIHG